MEKGFNGLPITVSNTNTSDNSEEKYYISFNHSSSGYGMQTTALVITIGDNVRQVYYILEGNHIEQYNKSKGLKECLTYYMNNKDLQHNMSDTFEHYTML